MIEVHRPSIGAPSTMHAQSLAVMLLSFLVLVPTVASAQSDANHRSDRGTGVGAGRCVGRNRAGARRHRARVPRHGRAVSVYGGNRTVAVAGRRGRGAGVVLLRGVLAQRCAERNATGHLRLQRRPGIGISLAAPRCAGSAARIARRRRGMRWTRTLRWCRTSSPGFHSPTWCSSIRIGTGFSRPAEGHEQTEFSGVEEDIESVGDFIRQMTTRLGRWSAPKFLCGESYGTLRSAGIAEYLQRRHHMFLDGIVLGLHGAGLQHQGLPARIRPTLRAAFAEFRGNRVWYHGKVAVGAEAVSRWLRVPRRSGGVRARRLSGRVGARGPADARTTPIHRRATGRIPSEWTSSSCSTAICESTLGRFAKELLRDEGPHRWPLGQPLPRLRPRQRRGNLRNGPVDGQHRRAVLFSHAPRVPDDTRVRERASLREPLWLGPTVELRPATRTASSTSPSHCARPWSRTPS